MMSLVRKIVFTTSLNNSETKISDLNYMEIIIMLLLSFITIILGLLPNIMLDITESAVTKLLINF